MLDYRFVSNFTVAVAVVGAAVPLVDQRVAVVNDLYFVPESLVAVRVLVDVVVLLMTMLTMIVAAAVAFALPAVDDANR